MTRPSLRTLEDLRKRLQSIQLSPIRNSYSFDNEIVQQHVTVSKYTLSQTEQQQSAAEANAQIDHQLSTNDAELTSSNSKSAAITVDSNNDIKEDQKPSPVHHRFEEDTDSRARKQGQESSKLDDQYHFKETEQKLDKHTENLSSGYITTEQSQNTVHGDSGDEKNHARSKNKADISKNASEPPETPLSRSVRMIQELQKEDETKLKYLRKVQDNMPQNNLTPSLASELYESGYAEATAQTEDITDMLRVPSSSTITIGNATSSSSSSDTSNKAYGRNVPLEKARDLARDNKWYERSIELERQMNLLKLKLEESENARAEAESGLSDLFTYERDRQALFQDVLQELSFYKKMLTEKEQSLHQYDETAASDACNSKHLSQHSDLQAAINDGSVVTIEEYNSIQNARDHWRSECEAAQRQVEELEKYLGNSKERIRDLEGQVADARAELADKQRVESDETKQLMKDYEHLKKQMIELNAQYRKVENENKSLRRQIDNIEHFQTHHRNQIHNSSSALKNQDTPSVRNGKQQDAPTAIALQEEVVSNTHGSLSETTFHGDRVQSMDPLYRLSSNGRPRSPTSSSKLFTQQSLGSPSVYFQQKNSSYPVDDRIVRLQNYNSQMFSESPNTSAAMMSFHDPGHVPLTRGDIQGRNSITHESQGTIRNMMVQMPETLNDVSKYRSLSEYHNSGGVYDENRNRSASLTTPTSSRRPHANDECDFNIFTGEPRTAPGGGLRQRNRMTPSTRMSWLDGPPRPNQPSPNVSAYASQGFAYNVLEDMRDSHTLTEREVDAALEQARLVRQGMA